MLTVAQAELVVLAAVPSAYANLTSDATVSAVKQLPAGNATRTAYLEALSAQRVRLESALVNVDALLQEVGTA